MRKLFYFFPTQLLLHHIKRNYLFTFLWLTLFAFVSEGLAVKYGVPYLFLAPEYLGKVNALSFLILGFSFGIFIMAFHITSYVLMGYRFRFIATLSSAFFKFCVNNSTIPLIFLLFFGYRLFLFNYKIHISFLSTASYYFSFLVGSSIFIIISALYLNKTNVSLSKILKISRDKEESLKNPIKKLLKRLFSPSISKKDMAKGVYPPETNIRSYLYHPFRIKLSRKSSHYKPSVILNILDHHHHNAAFYLIGIFLIIILLGIYRENNYFMIPSAACIIILFSMVLMLVSAIHSWFKGWSVPFFIAIVLCLNYLTTFKVFNSKNHAYGLDYNTEFVSYSEEKLQSITTQKNLQQDKKETLEILEKWKEKNTSTSGKKPKMIMINCSGGGMRASFFTFHVLNTINKATNGDFFNKTQLITGSSGGMMGASYFRELYLQKKNINQSHYKNISMDMLNPISFTITVNDIFLKFQKFECENCTFTKDRGFSFEYIFHQNTDSVLDKSIQDYYLPEKNAEIPMMVISPAIMNDGRFLNISPQPISYLSYNFADKYFDGIEFTRLFEQQNAENLRFSSALRMNATFPYISPVVYLPSSPMLEIMDAGITDNLGTQQSVKFLHSFQQWIKENTSGIILLQIRAENRHKTSQEKTETSNLTSIIRPIVNFNQSWGNMRDMERDKLLYYTKNWLQVPLDVITFSLKDSNQKVSLNWHLMEHEKETIINSSESKENIQALEQLKMLLH